jgi:hypothetical protein
MTKPDINWGKVVGISLIAIGLLQLIPPGIDLARNAWIQHQFDKEFEFSTYMDSKGHRLTPAEYQKVRNPTFTACYKHRQTHKEQCAGG